MIRVMYVIATLDAAGAERQMAQLARRLDRRDFEPMVCALTRGGPLEAELAKANVPVTILHKKGRWDLGAIGRLRREIRKFKPDIIHTWLPTSNTIGRIAGIMEKTPVMIASERARDAWKGGFRRAVDRFLARRTRFVLTNSRAVKDFLVRDVGLPDGLIEIIPNGLDLEEFDRLSKLPPAAPAPDGSSLEVGVVARLEPQKGLIGLIEAFSRLPGDLKARLWIAGHGPDFDMLKDEAALLNLGDRVYFLGRRSDIPALMNRFDLFVLPSLWEGLPNVVLEAMAAGKAVVATDVDGTPEAAIKGLTAMLVPPKDPTALAEAMEELLRDPEKRRRFGEAGRKRVEEHFKMEQMVERTQAVYRSAMENAG